MFNTLTIIDHHIYRDDKINGTAPDSTKSTFPIMTATGYQYLLAGNGLFVQAQNTHWQALVCIAPANVRGLPTLETTIHCHHGQIPLTLLDALLKDAAEARDDRGRHIEALYRICHSEGRWRLDKPQQTATPASVDTPIPRSPDTVLELHTHAAMAAFFSDTDTRDEQGLCAYGVVGRVGLPIQEICLRFGLYGYFHPLPLSALFGQQPEQQLLIRDLFHVNRDPSPYK